MVNRIAATVLAVTVLGVGAFAVVPREPPSRDDAPSRITNIEKNQVWPLKGNITLRPCDGNACEEL